VSIAELAAVRADDVAIGRLREHLDATRTAPNAAAFVDADVEFHLELARAACNPVLKDILISIRALLQAWIRRAIDRDGGIEATMAEHAAILTAVEAHPARRSATVMRRHLTGAGRRLGASLGTSLGESSRDGKP